LPQFHRLDKAYAFLQCSVLSFVRLSSRVAQLYSSQ